MTDKDNSASEDGLLTAAQALEFLFPEWMIDEKLTVKEAIFADVYSSGFEPLPAYRAALEAFSLAAGDDADDSKAADRFMRRRNLSRVLGRLIQERSGLPTAWLVNRLAYIASTDFNDFYEWDENGKGTLKPSRKMTLAQRAAISGIKRDKDTGEITEIKMWPKLDALDKLIRIQGLFRDKIEVTGKDGGPVKVILSKEDQTVL